MKRLITLPATAEPAYFGGTFGEYIDSTRDPDINRREGAAMVFLCFIAGYKSGFYRARRVDLLLTNLGALKREAMSVAARPLPRQGLVDTKGDV